MEPAGFALLVGVFLIGAAIYLVAMIENTYGYNRRMRKRLKELATHENYAFLNENLRLPKLPTVKDIAPLSLAFGGLWALYALDTPKAEGDALLVTGVILMAICHALLMLISLFHLYCTYKHPDWYGIEKELQVKNFLTPKQVNFFLKNVDKTSRWYSTLGKEADASEREVLNPDKLVSLLKMKPTMDTLIDLTESYEKLNKKGMEFTSEQMERKTKLYARLLKGYLTLSPHLKELIEATHPKDVSVSLVKKGEEEEEDIKQNRTVVSRNNFDKVEQQFLSSLQTLEMTKPVKIEAKEPVRELERVVKSTSLSEETRKQASVLLEQIQGMNEKEAEERGREMEEMDALAVIQANKHFYGVAEETR